jgi:hypothetical protein
MSRSFPDLRDVVIEVMEADFTPSNAKYSL